MSSKHALLPEARGILAVSILHGYTTHVSYLLFTGNVVYYSLRRTVVWPDRSSHAT